MVTVMAILKLLPLIPVVMVACAPFCIGEVIDFEQFTGPSRFIEAGNATDAYIATSIGTVVFSGGVILTDPTSTPADETSLYATAGNSSDINVYPGAGFENPISIALPATVTDFSIEVINGNTIPVVYDISNGLGQAEAVTLASNTAAGEQTVRFAEAGNTVMISATTGQSVPGGMTWDFSVDNISFTAASSGIETVPEPSSILLSFAAAPILFFGARRRRT